jgi:hypothetical protein
MALKLKRRFIYFGAPTIIVFGIVFSWWYHDTAEVVGQLHGNLLTLNGITYVSQANADPTQGLFFNKVGRTQGGDSIASIDGESPQNFVFVIGDMWQSTFRKRSLPSPYFSSRGISNIVFNGDSNNLLRCTDAKVIKDIVQILNSSSARSINILTTPTTKMYGLTIYLKDYPGLKFPFLIESKDGDLYLETNMQNNTYINIEGTAFGQWIHGQSKNVHK